MTYEYTVEEIKEALVKSVIECNPDYFKPYLDSEKVKYDAISKKAFFNFFKKMVCTSDANSVGALSVKIEPTVHPQKKNYCFYDQTHLHARLIISLEEKEDVILLNVLPF